MKILKSSHISPFGGLNFVLDEFDKNKIGQIINDTLPQLSPQSRYDWRDILYSYWSVFFCGGDCAEDLSLNFKPSLSQSPFLNVPSPDRVLNRLKEIAEPAHYYATPRGRFLHHFASNETLTDLNIAILDTLFSLSRAKVNLDYDNTICYTSKKDAQRTYQKDTGYIPAVGLVGSKVIYIENRNGRSNAGILQEDTLERMFVKLLDKGIKVAKFRADSASYSFKIIQTIERYSDSFYIKARMSASLARVIGAVKQWQRIDSKEGTIYRGETIYTPFERAARDFKQKEHLRPYRFVVTKEIRRDGQVNLFTKEAYKYSVIVTNDYNMPIDNIVFYYNKRGAIEREFDILKNDFGWNKLPFSKLEQNLVYLQVMGICRNLYHFIITLFSKRCKGLKPHFRIKKFIFRFVTIPGKWIKNSRQYKLKIYGEIHFKT
ncbi:hypothetical protein MHTCC0001_08000 [Flavobacteriaceae bacterium MHTCC 0001]